MPVHCSEPIEQPAVGSIGLWFWGRRGGGAQYALRLAEGFREIECHVVASLNQDNELLDDWRSAGIDVTGWRLTPRRLLSWALTPPDREWAAMREQSVRHVVFPMVHPMLLWALRRTKRAGLRTILVVHDARPHPGDRRGTPLLFLLRRAARSSDWVVAPTSHVAAMIDASWGLQRPCAVVPIGALLDTSAVGAAPTRGRRFLFFGRFERYKGLRLLADAWPDVVASQDDVRLVVAGEGSDPALAVLARQPGVTIINRWIDDAEATALFAEAAVVVLPYTEASQSGVVAIASGSGCAVIATDVGGLRDQLPAACLVPPDPAALAAAMIAAATNGLRFRPYPPLTWRTIARHFIQIVEAE